MKHLTLGLIIALIITACSQKTEEEERIEFATKSADTTASLYDLYDYLKTHGGSANAFNTRNLAENIEWHNTVKRNEIRGYGKFIFQHGEGPRVEEAKEMIKLIEYDHALHGDVHLKREFVQKYPYDTLAIMLADDHLDDLEDKPTQKAIRDHLESFPESPHKHKLEDFSIAIEAQHMIKGLKKNLNNSKHKSTYEVSKKLKQDGEFIEFSVKQNDFCYCTMKYRIEEAPTGRVLFKKKFETSNASLHVLDLDVAKITDTSFEGLGLVISSKYKNGFNLFRYEKGDDGKLLDNTNVQDFTIPLGSDERLKTKISKDLLKLAKICRGT